MTPVVVVSLTVAFLLALAVSWRRERRSGMWLERATLAMLVVCVAGGFFAIEGESRDRRDQICLGAEREHLASVEQLRRTYDYLTRLTPAEWEQTINKFVLKALPQTESDARTDSAPAFCDEPGLGLPEPDPVVPKRPAGLPPIP